MTTDDLEFQLSQYADGTLPAGERAGVEAILASDPAARAVLADYRRISRVLAAPPAGMDWDRLAERLSSAMSDDQPVVAGNIGPNVWRAAAAAAAAAAAVAVTVGSLSHHNRPAAVAVRPMPPAEVQVAEVAGPSIGPADGPVEAEVSIGASPDPRDASRYAEGVVSRQSTVVIAGAEAVPGSVLRVR